MRDLHKAALAQQAEPKGGGRLPPPLQAELDLYRCPQCNGPADNGHDRSIPPHPYLCTKCMAEPVHKCPNCASLEAQNTELDLKLAELERAIGKEPFGYLWPTGMHPEFRFTQQKRDGVDGMPLYTAPPQRKPLALTDDQIGRIWFEARIPGLVESDARRLIRAAEAEWGK